MTHSLLPTLALPMAVALAACSGGSGAARGTAAAGGAAAAHGSAGATHGSSGDGTGTATGGGTGAAAGGTAANVPAAAKALICPLPGRAFAGLNPSGPPGQGIPAGFSPVAVVRCLPVGGIAPAGGQWSYVRKEAAVAGLGPLLTALQEPTARHGLTGLVQGCPILVTVVPRLALIGRDGAVLYPQIPVTVCGIPRGPVLASLAALHWIMLSTHIGLQGISPEGVVTRQTAVRPSS
jgi:hypothetical protein